MHQVVSHAATVLSPGPWATGEPVNIEARAFFELPDEIGLRLLGRAIDTAGDEGPVELGKLEALCEALFKARRSARFRRTLAGAVITLTGGMLAVERARRAQPRPETALTKRDDGWVRPPTEHVAGVECVGFVGILPAALTLAEWDRRPRLTKVGHSGTVRCLCSLERAAGTTGEPERLG